MKKLIGILLAIALMMGGTGCMNSNEKIKDDMLDYVNEKYGETFEADTLVRANWAYHYDKLYAHPQGRPEDEFQIEHYVNEQGRSSFADGYFGILIKDAYQESIKVIVDPVFPESKIFVNFDENVFADRLNDNSCVSDIYNSEENFTTDTYVFIPQRGLEKSEFDLNTLKTIGKGIAEKKLVGGLAFYLLNDSSFDSLDEKNYNEFLSQTNGMLDHHNIWVNYQLEFYIDKMGGE